MADILPPLIYDGSTLAIPRASATQDGYLSRDDFILFSGGAVVPVTSFNTRTGEVVLLEDDVLAALGYVPLNKHGDTMTGPLLLPAGPPASDLAAVSKGYVDAHAGGGTSLPGNWILTSDFNASGSAATFTGGIAMGSSTLTLTSATHDFAIGQGISIVGAGDVPAVGGNLLVTRITAISGATITIANPAVHTVPSTAVVKHDDTVALQTAINYAFSHAGGVIWVTNGFYRLNGPLTAINSIIQLPYIAQDQQNVGVRLSGIIQPWFSFLTPSGAQSNVAIFQTDRIGVNSDSAMIAAAVWDGSTDINTPSNVTFAMANMVWNTYDNPQISGLDFGMAGNVTLENMLVSIGYDGSFTPAQPTHGTFGIRAPRVSTGLGIDNFQWVLIQWYHVGMYFAEFTQGQGITAGQCNIGFSTMAYNSHLTTLRLTFFWCPIIINIAHQCFLDIQISGESTHTGWQAETSSFNDPSNLAHGTIRYHNMLTDTGAQLALTRTGFIHTSFVNITGLGDTIATSVTHTNQLTAGDLNITNLLTSADVDVQGTLQINDGLLEVPVVIGAADSGGSGQRKLTVPNSTASTLITGLQHYWQMEAFVGGNIVDVHGASDLTPAGSPVIATGKIGNGYSTNAATGTMYVPGSVNLAAGDFTLTGWLDVGGLIRTRGEGPTPYSGGIGPFFCKGDSGASDLELYVFYYASGSQWNIQWGNAAQNVMTLTDATPIGAGFQFLCLTFNASTNTMTFSVNNNPGRTATLAGAAAIHHSAIAGGFGAMTVGVSGYNTAGVFDEVGLWSRILSSAEIATLYAGGAGLTYPF